MVKIKSLYKILLLVITFFISNNSFCKNKFFFEILDKNNIIVNNEYVIINTKTQNLFKIKIVNCIENNLIGKSVRLSIIIQPFNNKINTISINKTFTIKKSNLNFLEIKIPNLNKGQYFIYFSLELDNHKEFKTILLKIENKKWLYKSLSGLIGGLAIFLFGCSFLSKNLQKSAGYQFQNILHKLSKSKFAGLISGIIFTFIFQSSSATSVMIVSLVNSGIITLTRAIPILIGSAIGTTITVQLIAFRLTDYALLIVGTGFIFSITEKPLLKNIGGALMGVGFVFYGMHIMSESMQPLKNITLIGDVILKLKNPIIGILTGLILTALIQSSAAFIGIILTLSTQNLITLEASIPLILGTNLGTTITALLASINSSQESKQVALSYFIFKFLGIFIILPWITGFTMLVKNITYNIGHVFNIYNISGYEIREIANAHTIYNTFIALIFLPLSGLIEKIVCFILPPKKEHEEPFKTMYLDYSLIKTPSLAISAAKNEVIRMMENVKEMAEIILLAFITKNSKIIDSIYKKEKEINYLRDKINDYIVLISKQENDKKSVEEIFQIMFIINEFEHIADIISINMAGKALTWINSENVFSSQGEKEIIDFHKNTIAFFEKIIKLHQNFDIDEAKRIKHAYKEYRKLVFDLEKKHFERLKNDVKESIESSKVHIELLTMLKLITSHLINSIRILKTKNYNDDKDKSTN